MWGTVFWLILGWIGGVLALFWPMAEVFYTDSGKRAEIRQIDARIEELQEKKRGYEGKALRAEDQAERLQFEDRFMLETRQYFRIAEENRRQAQLAQEEIERLEKRKAELLGS